MTIPPRFFDELRMRLTLSEIIGKRVSLTRAGREFKACCPFHGEKTPSFTVNDDKQFYHCFGCGAHGDVIGFVMQHDNLSFIEAVEVLAAEAGMQVPKPSPQEVERAKKEKDLHSLLEEATRFFEKALFAAKNKEAQNYLQERQMSEEMRSAFRIGFAPADGQALRKALKEKDYSDEDMITAGVLRRSDKGGEPYSFFRERIMFPVTDRRGRVVAFGGRILPDHLRAPSRGDFKPPKYINSSDTPLFHKGMMLYNESQARQAAADGKPVIVVEGYLDVMACFEAGYHGAVAPLGTALTEDQIAALWRIIPGDRKVPVLCFDGDNAGRRAAARACENILPLLKPGQSAQIAFLPEGQDPDSLIKAHGKSAFAKILESALPLASFVWQYHTEGQNFDSPEDRAGLSKSLENTALKIGDRTVQQYYRQTFRDMLFKAFAPKKFAQGRGGGPGRKNAPLSPPVRVRRPALKQQQLYEQILLATVINHPAILESVEEALGEISFWQERLDLLRQTLLNMTSEFETLDSEGVRNHLKEQGFEKELDLLLSRAVLLHAWFARPDTEDQDVLSGWNEIRSALEREKVFQEKLKSGKALAGDFSEESEKKMLALHRNHEASEG